MAADVAAGIGDVHHRFSHVLDGFSATLTASEAAALRSDPRVEQVIPDQAMTAGATQASPPWGLDRIDQRPTAGDSAYDYDTTGAGVTVFVLDTGIRFSHTEFGGRASSGYDVVDGDPDASDCHGHGTHVAGTIGGGSSGVAKDVTLIAVRIWDCSGHGWMSDL